MRLAGLVLLAACASSDDAVPVPDAAKEVVVVTADAGTETLLVLPDAADEPRVSSGQPPSGPVCEGCRAYPGQKAQ